MCSAMYRDPPASMSASPTRCSTSVGTRIAGNASRTSTSEFMSINAWIVEGVVDARMRCAHHCCIGTSADGQRIRMSASQSHPFTSRSE
jgi:hypothetical protein